MSGSATSTEPTRVYGPRSAMILSMLCVAVGIGILYLQRHLEKRSEQAAARMEVSIAPEQIDVEDTPTPAGVVRDSRPQHASSRQHATRPSFKDSEYVSLNRRAELTLRATAVIFAISKLAQEMETASQERMQLMIQSLTSDSARIPQLSTRLERLHRLPVTAKQIKQWGEIADSQVQLLDSPKRASGKTPSIPDESLEALRKALAEIMEADLALQQYRSELAALEREITGKPPIAPANE